MRLLFCVFFVLVAAPLQVFAQSDLQIKDQLIRNSLSQYEGNCACPYHMIVQGVNAASEVHTFA